MSKCCKVQKAEGSGQPDVTGEGIASLIGQKSKVSKLHIKPDVVTLTFKEMEDLRPYCKHKPQQYPQTFFMAIKLCFAQSIACSFNVISGILDYAAPIR